LSTLHCPQVTHLQQQVSMLQQSRDIQDKELARLKAEALSLAARTAAAAVISNSVGSPAGGAPGGRSSRPSSSGSADGVHVSQLQAQLSRLQRELTAAQADRQQLQEQLAHLAAGSNSSSGVSDTD
jgi:Tfp pilus assembly protein FimV